MAKSPGGTNLWRDNTVRSILSNERYKDDALLQKYYTVDFLNKKLKKNEGEVPQYYIENDHDAIVSKEMFDSVQREISSRLDIKGKSNDIISNKLFCGYCGGRFGKKVWHSNDKENLSAKHLVFLILYEDKYRKVVYRCNDKFTKTEKFENKERCKSLTLTEDQIKDMFMSAFNSIIQNKDEIIKNIESTLKYFDVSKLETEYNTLETSLQAEIDKINNKVYEQAAGKDVEIDHSKYEALKAKLDKVGEKINEMNDKKNKLKEYIEELKRVKNSKYRDEYKHREKYKYRDENRYREKYKYNDCDFRAEQFRAEFWGQFLDKMVVYKDRVKVVFKDGREVVKEV